VDADVVMRKDGGNLPAMTVDNLVEQVQLIQGAMKKVMKRGEHYGVIPGTTKPTLLKPGAQKLCTLFRLAPRIKSKTWTEHHKEHRTCEIVVELIHITTGDFCGEGIGVCSTLEKRYRYMSEQRNCPECGVIGAIIKGKVEYGGGWLCWKKKGGCDAKWDDNDPVIADQKVGIVEREDLADLWNTIAKMAMKRAVGDAVLTATAASDIFTQDIGDREGDPDKKGEAKTSRPQAASADEPSRASPGVSVGGGGSPPKKASKLSIKKLYASAGNLINDRDFVHWLAWMGFYSGADNPTKELDLVSIDDLDQKQVSEIIDLVLDSDKGPKWADEFENYKTADEVGEGTTAELGATPF